MASLTYAASITPVRLLGHLTQSIFPPVRRPVYLFIILRLFKHTASTAEPIAYDVKLKVKLIMKGK